MPTIFIPAQEVTDRFGCFAAVIGGTNSGKTFSSMRLAAGIVGPGKRFAAADSEGGRLLHLKDDFDFDLAFIEPPHHPKKYEQMAEDAERAGYGALVIDSFSMEWVGPGGVLDWQSDNLMAAVERQRANAEKNNWTFDEYKTTEKLKPGSWAAPKGAHKDMVYAFLQRRIPIIFSIRAEEKLIMDVKPIKTEWRPITNKMFPFEVTVSFMLMADTKGIIDLSRPFKMERSHTEIFRDKEQLCERHGQMLETWARGRGEAVRTANEILLRARSTAGLGSEHYRRFWEERSKAEKADLLAHHEQLKGIAAAADRAEDAQRQGHVAETVDHRDDNDGFPAETATETRTVVIQGSNPGEPAGSLGFEGSHTTITPGDRFDAVFVDLKSAAGKQKKFAEYQAWARGQQAAIEEMSAARPDLAQQWQDFVIGLVRELVSGGSR